MFILSLLALCGVDFWRLGLLLHPTQPKGPWIVDIPQHHHSAYFHEIMLL